MHRAIPITRSASGLRIGIAVSRYHDAVTAALCEGAVKQFTEAGGREEDLLIVPAPGAFELVAICRAMASRGDLHAVVALGCVITGETTHDQHIASAVAQGIAGINASTATPVAFGVLTCRTMEQAVDRAGGEKGNKGAEAMAAAVACAHAIDALDPARAKESHR